MPEPTSTTGAAGAAAALRESVEMNRAQQALTEESRLLLTSMVRDEMRVAVAEGIAAAMTDAAAERFWEKGLEVLQRQATERTGRFVLGGLTQMLKKAFWIGVLVLAVYSVGGWALVKAAWIAVSKG